MSDAAELDPRHSSEEYSDEEDIRRPFLESSSTLVQGEEFDAELGAGLQKRATPVPLLQLLILCAVRIVDPISFTQIFPYVNEMMVDLHVTDNLSQIGFYSGLVDSVFSVSQLFSIYHWSKLSDRVGRRPVIFTSTIGIALCTTWFGLSTTFSSVLAARCISGLLTGNVAVILSALGELTDETNQAIVYPVYGLVWPIGGIIGPLVGGTFSHPDVHFPAYFDTPFFRRHPYFLPCVMCSVLSLTAAAVGLRFLEETHPLKRKSRQRSNSIPMGKLVSPVTPGFKDEPHTYEEPPAPSHSMRSLINIPLIRALCLSGFALAFLATAFDVVFVLFSYSPIETGGLARPPDLIGYSLAIAGITSAAIQLFLMPWLLRTFDLAIMYKFAMALFPIAFFSLPCLNILARMGTDENGTLTDPWVKFLLWVGIAITLGINRVAVLGFSLNMILAKNASPTPEALGTTNAISQFFQSFGRSISPAFVSSLFALSVDNNLLGGNLWVVIMCGIGCVSCWITARIADVKARAHAESGRVE